MPREPEIRLSGGWVNEVVRTGDTVRRSAGPWTPAVHALLRHPWSRYLAKGNAEAFEKEMAWLEAEKHKLL